MAYVYPATTAEYSWFRAMLSLAINFTQRYALDPTHTGIAIGVGEQDTSSSAYKRGYRGPATVEGRTALELVRGVAWGLRAGCGPWEPVVKQSADRTGARVFAALGLPVGVFQIVRMDDMNLRYSVYATATLPALSDWCEDPVLSRLAEQDATSVMAEIAEAHRVDALTPLLPVAQTAALL